MLWSVNIYLDSLHLNSEYVTMLIDGDLIPHQGETITFSGFPKRSIRKKEHIDLFIKLFLNKSFYVVRRNLLTSYSSYGDINLYLSNMKHE